MCLISCAAVYSEVSKCLFLEKASPIYIDIYIYMCHGHLLRGVPV